MRMLSSKQFLIGALALAGIGAVMSVGTIPSNGQSPAPQKAGPQLKFTPEFMERVGKLPPEFMKQFAGIAAKHPRKSDKATLRQVMLELLQDTQCVVMGISSDSYEATAECAERASEHRFPRGHLLAYGPLDNINMNLLSSIPEVNAQVEGGFDRIAKYAKGENMPAAAEEMGKVLAGCVKCHAIFRMNMGDSPYILHK